MNHDARKYPLALYCKPPRLPGLLGKRLLIVSPTIAGSYDIGWINDTAYTGDLTYTAVTKLPGYWKFTSTGYGVGSDAFVDESIVGIADTGTTLIYLPAAIVKAYYAEVSGATNSLIFGGYIFDCDADLPDFSFGVEDAVITVPAEYINFVRISSCPLSILFFSSFNLITDSALCYVGDPRCQQVLRWYPVFR